MKRLIIILFLLSISSFSVPITVIKVKKNLVIKLTQPWLCSVVIKSSKNVYGILFKGPIDYTLGPFYGRVELRLECTSIKGHVVTNLSRVYLFPNKEKIKNNKSLYYIEVSKALRLYDMLPNKDPLLYKEIELSYVLFRRNGTWKEYLDKIIEKESKLLQPASSKNISLLSILKDIQRMQNKIRLIYQVYGVVSELENCINHSNKTGHLQKSCLKLYLNARKIFAHILKSFKSSQPKYIIYTDKFNETFGKLEEILQKINQSLNSDQDLEKNASILENYLDKLLKMENNFKKSLINETVVVVDWKNRSIPLAVVTVNGVEANVTNFNGTTIIKLVSPSQKINATAPGYKFLTIKKDKDSVVIILKPKLNLSPIVYHYLIVNYTYGAICSTLDHPHCTRSYNGTVYLHPNSTIIRKLVSVIPKNYITLCKSGVNCTKLLWNISALIHGVVKYNKHCLTKNLTEFKKYCMAWWDTDLDIVKYHSGVCSDYARLALSILRSLGIPARYVVIHGWAFGFGYFDHVFTQVYANGHWIFYDPLWNYTVVPQYPLLCVNSIYTPYAVTYGNITIVRKISLIKDLLKYYNISTNCSKAL